MHYTGHHDLAISAYKMLNVLCIHKLVYHKNKMVTFVYLIGVEHTHAMVNIIGKFHRHYVLDHVNVDDTILAGRPVAGCNNFTVAVSVKEHLIYYVYYINFKIILLIISYTCHERGGISTDIFSMQI